MPRLLVVEDSDLVARSLMRMLGRHFTIVRVDDGEAARNLLSDDRAEEYDLILSDVTMPRLDGLGLLCWVREARPELVHRLAFMTADPLCPAAVEIGRTHPVLRKPVARETILAFAAAVNKKT